MNVFIAGSGKLANALLSANLTLPACEVLAWESGSGKVHEKSIVIHAGSGRQLAECVSFCQQTDSVLIELSTGLETETMDPGFTLIVCPNTSILLLKTLHMLNLSGHHFANYQLSITESHQAAKKTEPGTAYTFAKSLHFPVDKIVSIRDPHIQATTIGLPSEFIDKHAYHKIVIQDGNDTVMIETKVLGHGSYAAGVEKIVEAALNHPLEKRRYTVLELIEANML